MCLLFVWDVVPCKEEVCYAFTYNATNYDFVGMMKLPKNRKIDLFL